MLRILGVFLGFSTLTACCSRSFRIVLRFTAARRYYNARSVHKVLPQCCH